MSGKVHPPARPLMPAEQASQLLDQVVHQRVRELINFCCLLDFEQELRLALLECGLTRDSVQHMAAQMVANALRRIGEDHVQVVLRLDAELEAERKKTPPD